MMTIRLHSLSAAGLRALAACSVPAALPGAVADGAAAGIRGGTVAASTASGSKSAPECRKQGIAKAAVCELVRVAFGGPEVGAVLAQVNADNLGSTRVVQSLGFDAHGTVLDDEGELLVQWIRRRSSAAGCDSVPVER